MVFTRDGTGREPAGRGHGRRPAGRPAARGGRTTRASERLDGVVHVRVDAQLARDGKRLAHDLLGGQLGVVQQCLGGRMRVGTAGADGHDALLRLQHVAVAGDDERGAGIGHGQHGLQAAQHAVGAPVLGELDGGARQVALVLFQLGFEALEEGEGVGRGAREAREHLAVVQLAHLARRALHDDVAERDLPVAADGDLDGAVRGLAADAEDGGAVKLFHSVRNWGWTTGLQQPPAGAACHPPGTGSVLPRNDTRVLVDADDVEEHRHQPRDLGEVHHVAQGLLGGCPVQHGAGGGEIHARQPVAADGERHAGMQVRLHGLEDGCRIALDVTGQHGGRNGGLQPPGLGGRLAEARGEGIRVEGHRGRCGMGAVAASIIGIAAVRGLPGRRGNLVGDAVVQRDQFELVGPAHQPQCRHAQAPPVRRNAPVAGRRAGLQQARQGVHALEDDGLGTVRPLPELLRQARDGPFLDGHQARPGESPGRSGRPGHGSLQGGHRLGREHRRCIPEEFARGPAGGFGGSGRRLHPQEFGHGEPQRRGAAEPCGEIDGQRLEAGVVARGTVEIEERHPELGLPRRVLVALVLRERLQQAGLCAGVVAVREADRGLLQVGFVHVGRRLGRHVGRRGARRRIGPLGEHGGRQRTRAFGGARTGKRLGHRGGHEVRGGRQAFAGEQRLHAGLRQPRRQAGRGGGCERAGVRRVGGIGGAEGRRFGGRHAGRRTGGHRLLALPPLLGHLRLDLVDLLERDGPVVRRSHAGMEERGPGGLVVRPLAVEGLALAQLAQLIELAAPHEIVAALALDHFLEHLLAVLAFALLVDGVELIPVDGGIAYEAHHLGQQAAGGIFLAHGSSWLEGTRLGTGVGRTGAESGGTGRSRAGVADAVPSVPEHLLLELPALLRLQGQGGGGARQEAADADGLAGLVAVAVVACVDARDGLLDLLEQLALAVAGAQFQGVLFLDGGTVGRIGHHHGVLAQVLGGLARVVVHVLLELHELVPEERQLLLVHVFAVGHGKHLGVGEFLGRLGLPVIGQLRVFLGGRDGRLRLQGRRHDVY